MSEEDNNQISEEENEIMEELRKFGINEEYFEQKQLKRKKSHPSSGFLPLPRKCSNMKISKIMI